DIEKRCAQLLADGQIVARCKGKMEFGARALGNRSILADPGSWQTIHVINAMIKQRDFWMPFAPSMLAEYADDYIVNPKGIKAPHMILSFDSKKEILPEIIAAVHPYDGSCRPQVVEKEMNPDYHRLIDMYRELTGKAVVLNTSFNLHGFPVVYSPKDALDVFDKSGLKYLALENVLVQEIE
ncbi:MAG: carbamoyl transferase, partial [Bacteroidetes bacterium]|nr:carbamoyl transferase [Bacteroidota bacterium]